MASGLIKVGVVGVGRGQSFARGAGEHVGMQLVAQAGLRPTVLEL